MQSRHNQIKIKSKVTLKTPRVRKINRAQIQVTNNNSKKMNNKYKIPKMKRKMPIT